MFDIDRSQAHHWAHRLQPILEAALGEKKALPERQINSVQAFIERFPGVERNVMELLVRFTVIISMILMTN